MAAIQVDPSQVQSITVDPSQVQAVSGTQANQAAQVPNNETFLGGLWNNVNPMPALKMVLGAAGDPGAASELPGKIVGGLIAAHVDQLEKAKAAWASGDHVEALGHLLATGLPLLGPMAAHAAETMGGTAPEYDKYGNVVKSGQAPNLAGGLGEGAGLLLPAGLDAAGSAANQVMGRVAPNVAKGLYRVALKSGFTAGSKTPAEIRALVDAGLSNGIPITEQGAARLSKAIDDLQTANENAAASYAKAGASVDPGTATSGLPALEARAGAQATPQTDLADIAQVKQDFLAAHPNPMPADEALAVKSGTQRKVQQLEGYGQEGSAQVEALKSIGHEVREELVRQIPELADGLPRQQDLVNLDSVIQKAVNKAAANGGNGAGLKALITTGVLEGLVKNHPMAAAGVGMLKWVLGDPGVRSRLAIAVNRAQQANPTKWGAPNVGVSLSRVNQVANSLDQFAQGQRNSSQTTQ